MSVLIGFLVIMATSLVSCVRSTTTSIPISNTVLPGGGVPRSQSFKPSPIQLKPENLPKPKPEQHVNHPPQILPIPADPVLYLPAGFVVTVFVQGLQAPRWMEMTPNGELLVTESKGARIRILKILSDFSKGQVMGTFAEAEQGIDQAMGMGFLEDQFLVANTAGLRSYPYVPGQAKLSGRGKEITSLPKDGYNNHWTRNLVVDRTKKKLYVSVGSTTDHDVEPAPRGTILEMNYDGSDRRVYASGMRNPIGFDIHPITGELFSTVTERDGLGNDLVPDFFTRVQEGGFYGWPFAYISPNFLDPRRTVNGASERPDLAAKTLIPEVLFQAHASPIGFRFARGNNFPEPYSRGGFAALRGSWNRSSGVGFEVVHIPFDTNNNSLGYYESFVRGFLVDENHNHVWGRPVGIYFLPDGSLLFTEEANGRIYRVHHTGQDGDRQTNSVKRNSK